MSKMRGGALGSAFFQMRGLIRLRVGDHGRGDRFDGTRLVGSSSVYQDRRRTWPARECAHEVPVDRVVETLRVLGQQVHAHAIRNLNFQNSGFGATVKLWSDAGAVARLEARRLRRRRLRALDAAPRMRRPGLVGKRQPTAGP